MPLPPYTTTVVGSYSVPRWYEVLEKQVEAGELAAEDMADAQFRASQAAISDQDAAGIDVVNGGELHRRTNNRHAPPNAMLNYFWARIPGFSTETRPKAITPKDPGVTHPAAVLNGHISYGDLGLAEEYRMVSKYARGQVKVTMTGPHMLAKVAWDEYYGDVAKVMQDLAPVLNRNFRELAEAGCTHVQIDEPLFAIADREEVAAAVDAVNEALDGVPMTTWVHICQGNYSVSADYDGGDQIGHRYFDLNDYPADLISGIRADALMIEFDYVDRYESLLRNQQLAVGAADVQDRTVETGEQLAERVAAHSWLSPEQTLITSSCGMNHLPRSVAAGKLTAMAEAARLLRGR